MLLDLQLHLCMDLFVYLYFLQKSLSVHKGVRMLAPIGAPPFQFQQKESRALEHT